MIKHSRIISLTAILLTTFVLNSNAQEKSVCPCCTEKYDHFNYWLGSWEVYDTTGTKVGSNVITELENGCLIKEQWTSTGKHTGTSYNFYNKADDSWNQVWVDNQGNVLDLKGGLINGSMTLKSAMVKDKDGNEIFHRITWFRQKDGTVKQVWDVVRANGEVASNLFTGIYKKSEVK